MPSRSDIVSPQALVLTALEVEYDAIRQHLRQCVRIDHPKGDVYEVGQFHLNGVVCDVAVLEVGVGEDRAALAAERAIRFFDPRIAMFVGVAGGLKDVRLGDVVVADKVYGYERAEARTELRPRPDVGESSHALLELAKYRRRNSHWQASFDLQMDTPTRVIIGPIAAGEKVVKSTRSQVFRFLRRQYSDALAVEMEGRGFLRATHANHPVQAIVVRGISDLLDAKETSDQAGSQALAARHASAFALHLLADFSGTKTTFYELRTLLQEGELPDVLAALRRCASDPTIELRHLRGDR